MKVNEERTKPAHDVKARDVVSIRSGDVEWTVTVLALSDKRGPADAARKLYQESEPSRAERERRQDLRRYSPEPASSIKGRPTKRDRRRLDDFLK